MSNKHLGLFAFLLALLIVVSPVQGQNSVSVNSTRLSVWDTSDSQDVYVFEPLTFHADYTNSTSNQSIPGTCTIIYNYNGVYNGTWSEPVQMDYSDDVYTYSEDFVYPGTYLFQVTCDNLTVWDDWTYQNYPDRICTLDALFTQDSEGFPVPKIRNTGNWFQEVTYELRTEEDVLASNTRTLEAGETVTLPLNWPGGTHDLELEAISDCGYSETEKMTFGHQVQEEYSCQYPLGYEGSNYCDYQNQRVMVCSDGEWEEDENRHYCYDCEDTCGDGVINCGETLQTCPCDARENSGWLDEYRCSGDTVQRKKLSYEYGYEWVDYRECPAGCSGGECNPICGIEITSFEHSDRFTSAQTGRATLTIRNTGEADTEGEVVLYLDGSEKAGRSFTDLHANDSRTMTLKFSSHRGEHRISAIVHTECGEADSANSDIQVYQAVQATADPYGPENVLQPLETDVWVTQNALDMYAGTSRTIPVHIQSEKPQVFEITVSGVPDDWVSHTSEIEVERRDTVYLYLTGKEEGSWNLKIQARAREQKLDFTHRMNLYVGSDRVEEPGFKFQPNLSGLMALGETQAAVGLMLVFVIFVLGFGVFRLREPDILEDE